MCVFAICQTDGVQRRCVDPCWALALQSSPAGGLVVRNVCRQWVASGLCVCPRFAGRLSVPCLCWGRFWVLLEPGATCWLQLGEACVCVCRFVVVLVLLLCVLGTSMCHWILLWYYLDLLPIVPGLQQPLHVCRASLLALGAHSGIRLVVLILLGFYPGVVETAL
jgi:hypothetical protein